MTRIDPQNRPQIRSPDWSRDGLRCPPDLARGTDPQKQVLFSVLLTVAELYDVSHKDWIRPPSRALMTNTDLIDPRRTAGYKPRSTPLSLRNGPTKFVSRPVRARSHFAVRSVRCAAWCRRVGGTGVYPVGGSVGIPSRHVPDWL